MSKELGGSHIRVVVDHMVVAGNVKEFLLSRMQAVIVLGVGDIEIGNPPQLSIDISVFVDLCVVWHAGAFDCVHVIRIHCLPWSH